MIENALQQTQSELVCSSTDIERRERSWEDLPHETLVEVIKSALDEEKMYWELRNGEGTFDPIMWVGEHLTSIGFFRCHRNDEAMQKLSYAWDALTQPYLKSPRHRNIVSGIIRDVSQVQGRHIPLAPKAVKLLDAMTDAVNVRVPRRPGDREVDLFANLPGLIPGHRRIQDLWR